MGVELAKDSIDLGIIISDPGKQLAFYRDTLGFRDDGVMEMGGGTKLYRLLCGTSLIKLMHPGTPPAAKAAPGGIQGATGYRYWTISVSNLDALAKRIADGGYKVVIEPREIRPGVRIAMAEDPEGNWVEFLESR